MAKNFKPEIKEFTGLKDPKGAIYPEAGQEYYRCVSCNNLGAVNCVISSQRLLV